VLPTQIGQMYHVTFSAYGGQLENIGEAAAGRVDLVFTPAPATHAWVASYHDYAFDFVAGSDTSTLRFTALQSDGFGPVIDDVNVSVPESRSLAAAFAGALFLGLAKRRSLIRA
jgi:hypothetical protein